MKNMNHTTCNTIKRDGFWCTGKPVVVVNGYGYCARHKANADGKAYPPVSAEEQARQAAGIFR
jgi:hypothetical protein